MATLKRRLYRSTLIALMPLAIVANTYGQTPSAGTPATPIASPSAMSPGCAALGPWFLDLAALAGENDGLATMQGVGFDVTKLSAADAASVVDSLEDLIAGVEALTPPEPAAAYHRAYLGMLGWYRDLAASQGPGGYQDIVNNDRALFVAMGQAIFTGQSICGAEVWNAAWDVAFP